MIWYSSLFQIGMVAVDYRLDSSGIVRVSPRSLGGSFFGARAMEFGGFTSYI